LRHRKKKLLENWSQFCDTSPRWIVEQAKGQQSECAKNELLA
jgi:hypothetical protein